VPEDALFFFWARVCVCCVVLWFKSTQPGLVCPRAFALQRVASTPTAHRFLIFTPSWVSVALPIRIRSYLISILVVRWGV
jgi:hypothetical protein